MRLARQWPPETSSPRLATAALMTPDGLLINLREECYRNHCAILNEQFLRLQPLVKPSIKQMNFKQTMDTLFFVAVNAGLLALLAVGLKSAQRKIKEGRQELA